MNNKYSYRNNKPVLDKEGIIGTRFFENKKIQIVHISLAPFSELKAHKSDVDALLYVLSGTVEVEIGNEVLKLEKDELVEFPKDVLHSVKNIGEKEAKVLVMKILG
ncbi:cupin domain-containing protein [Thermosipho affectus]|uniref:cupin domain-containing protein n=1 Tax=Thermosipho affectus TaxID=660294 RepID=UPI0009812EAF|nr:cupin domain-containing protein [Thermosipho affectus]